MTTTDPYITRELADIGIRSTCHLCHDFNVAADSLHRHDDADNWEQAHADACNPAAVRQRAAGLRDAIDVIRDLADNGDPALWDESDGQRAHAAIINRLQVRALELEINVDTATASSSGSGGPRAHDNGGGQ